MLGPSGPNGKSLGIGVALNALTTIARRQRSLFGDCKLYLSHLEIPSGIRDSVEPDWLAHRGKETPQGRATVKYLSQLRKAVSEESDSLCLENSSHERGNEGFFRAEDAILERMDHTRIWNSEMARSRTLAAVRSGSIARRLPRLEKYKSAERKKPKLAFRKFYWCLYNVSFWCSEDEDDLVLSVMGYGDHRLDLISKPDLKWLKSNTPIWGSSQGVLLSQHRIKHSG
ncbi:hypothetical protein WN48_01584 [Eufriesea mexicana]|nr:hypothetical protein WN48_01584 [Eufriesea mexicana]